MLIKNSKNQKTSKVDLDIPLVLFKNLISYLFSEQRSRSFVKKLGILFKIINTKKFEEDADISVYYEIVNTIVKTILDENINSIELILHRVEDNKKLEDENLDEILAELIDIELDSEMTIFIENEFIDRLNFANTLPVLTRLKKNVGLLEKNEFSSFREGVSVIQDSMAEFKSLVSMRSTQQLSIPDINFGDPNLSTIITGVHKALNSERRMIKTGIKRLNKMLHGGFQPGRCYVFMATSGGWKSGLLLNIFLWAAKYNTGLRCRDQSRKPLYIYLTQENDNEETLDRLFSYLGSVENERIVDSPEEIIEKMRNEGIVNLESHNILMLYRRKYSINCNDIENMVKELELEGEYEVKMLVHDYIKRMKPNVDKGDERLNLGEIANDFSELSKALKIPIITANQVNRTAYDTLMQQGKNENKNDLGKQASLSMQSESALITENVDFAAAINREVLKSTDTWYLTFTDLKNRAARSLKSYSSRYFAIPFERNNGMRLMEDFNLEGDEEYAVNSVADQLESYEPSEASDSDKTATAISPRRVKRRSINEEMDE